MTTSSRKQSYNYLALRGADLDDMEYVEEFGVPAEFAYTKQINDFMLDKVQTENEQYYMQDGMPEPEAKAMAREKRMKAEADINTLYQLNNL